MKILTNLQINKIKSLRSIFVIIVVLITGIFFSKSLTQYYQQIQNNIHSISVTNGLISLLLYAGYLYFRATSWRALIYFLGASVNRSSSLKIWFFSEATRYVPGNIWSFAGRAYLAQQHKIPRNISLLVLPIEIATVTIVTSILSLYAILINLGHLPLVYTYIAAIFGSLLVLLFTFFFRNKIRKIVGNFLEQDLKTKYLFIAILLQLLSWSLYALATLIIVSSFTELSNIPLLLSSAVLAWLLGYLSIITPMGLGVRETAFAMLVGQQLGIANAVIIAIVSRVILIIAELSILIFLAIYKRLY